MKISILLSIQICTTCFGYAQSREYVAVKSPIVLPVNNKDYKKIGFELVQGDESIGVKSIALADSVIYLVDAFHNNIKKINLTTGKMQSSLPLNSKRAWLRDLIIFDKKIFVLSDLETNYILDLNLKLIRSFKLPSETKYAYNSFKDSLLIFRSDRVIAINNEGKVLYTRYEHENLTPLKMAHGREYSINGKTIKTKFGVAHIISNFPYTSEKYYDAINIDFNEKQLTYFEVNPNYLKIFFTPIR